MKKRNLAAMKERDQKFNQTIKLSFSVANDRYRTMLFCDLLNYLLLLSIILSGNAVSFWNYLFWSGKRCPLHLKVTYGPGHAKMSLMPYANNKGADQPVHPCNLINTFVVRCLNSMICILAISKVSRLQLASVAEQAGLGLPRSQTPEDTFSHDEAHLFWSGKRCPLHLKAIANRQQCSKQQRVSHRITRHGKTFLRGFWPSKIIPASAAIETR